MQPFVDAMPSRGENVRFTLSALIVLCTDLETKRVRSIVAILVNPSVIL